MAPELTASHPLLRRLAAALAARPGRLATFDGEPARAAVALIFRVSDLGVPELLFIKRAEREGDPWSGHVALPGGRRQSSDATLQDTAVRETLEETSMDLATHGRLLGTLDELHPRTPTLPPIVVTPYVFTINSGIEPVANLEVAEAFWIPWSVLSDPSVLRESTVPTRAGEWRVPSYVLGHHIVWGMTERILSNLMTLLA